MDSPLESILDQAEEAYLIPCRKEDGTVDLLARAGNGDTLLHVAVGQRDIVAIRRLLEAGLDIDARGDFFETPFFSAAARGDIGLMGFLLQHGANPNIPNDLGMLPCEALLRKLKGLSESRLLKLSAAVYTNIQAQQAAASVIQFRLAFADYIALLASAEEQIAYEKKVPDVFIPAEIIECFATDLFHPKDHSFIAAFSESELKSISRLYGLVCSASDLLDAKQAHSVTDALKLAEWRAMMTFAKSLTKDIPQGEQDGGGNSAALRASL